ncbi:MAG: tripartite tricarboxylate transporter permease [Desulfitobacterium hafniense]|nr:tripartite tricarboxylate transporter permease [Desulfitobacterium hafniense]
MLEASLSGLAALFTGQAMIFMSLGVAFGLLIGFLPGLGGVVAMALLLPFTFGLEPAAALAMLLGAHVATIFGSSISGILFNVPGAAKSVSICFDGYPMTQKGEGARALGAAAMASFLGGIFGAIALTISLPFMRAIMMSLGPPEYFMMALWGLTIIAIFSDGSVLKGIIAAGLGLLIAFIGMDPVTGTPRYTFGSLFLLDGIDFSVAVIGLFAISQMIKLYVKGGSIVEREINMGHSTVWDGVKDVFKHWRLVLSSSVLGLFIGALPGVGASIGGVAAYGQAVQTSKNPEKFGTGAVEGVIAPEATNAANEGGGLIPTLGFGVPGGESMTILLSAFVTMGIQPGKELITNNLHLVFTMVWIIVIANLLTTGFGIFTAKKFAKLTTLPGTVLIPVILAVCFVGAYSVKGRIGDVVVAAVFGVIGYLLEKYDYSRADMVIGMVLGLMLERYMHISLTLHGKLFFVTRPVTLVMLIFVLITLAYPFIRKWRLSRNGGAV